MIIKNPLIVSSGGGDTKTIKNLLDARKNANELFFDYREESVDAYISYNDTANITAARQMFYNCINLKTIPLLNTSGVKDMYAMFNNCKSLTSIPLLDTSNVSSMYDAFSLCKSLTVIPAIDVSKVNNTYGMFSYCSAIEEIHMTGMKVSFNISASTKFTEAALVEILNNLATVTETNTLTMGATNLAKLTDEDKAIATNKGWTLA